MPAEKRTPPTSSEVVAGNGKEAPSLIPRLVFGQPFGLGKAVEPLQIGQGLVGGAGGGSWNRRSQSAPKDLGRVARRLPAFDEHPVGKFG